MLLYRRFLAARGLDDHFRVFFGMLFAERFDEFGQHLRRGYAAETHVGVHILFVCEGHPLENGVERVHLHKVRKTEPAPARLLFQHFPAAAHVLFPLFFLEILPYARARGRRLDEFEPVEAGRGF